MAEKEGAPAPTTKKTQKKPFKKQNKQKKGQKRQRSTADSGAKPVPKKQRTVEYEDLGAIDGWDWAEVSDLGTGVLGGDDVSGFLCLEEIDGVDVDYTETDAGKVVSFRRAKKPNRGKAKKATPDQPLDMEGTVFFDVDTYDETLAAKELQGTKQGAKPQDEEESAEVDDTDDDDVDEEDAESAQEVDSDDNAEENEEDEDIDMDKVVKKDKKTKQTKHKSGDVVMEEADAVSGQEQKKEQKVKEDPKNKKQKKQLRGEEAEDLEDEKDSGEQPAKGKNAKAPRPTIADIDPSK